MERLRATQLRYSALARLHTLLDVSPVASEDFAGSLTVNLTASLNCRLRWLAGVEPWDTSSPPGIRKLLKLSEALSVSILSPAECTANAESAYSPRSLSKLLVKRAMIGELVSQHLNFFPDPRGGTISSSPLGADPQLVRELNLLIIFSPIPSPVGFLYILSSSHRLLIVFDHST